MVKIIFIRILRLYFLRFPIRKGKIPVLRFFDKLNLFKNVTLTGELGWRTKVVLNLSDWVQQLVYFFKIYEFEKRETYAWVALVNENSTILDIGANFGYYSLLSSDKFSSVKVYSFEPVPETFCRLKQNVKLNNYNNIELKNLGVSNSAGKFTMYLADENNSGMSSLAKPSTFSGKEVTVNVITIDGFVNEQNILEIDLVKIDVEGNELNVLLGMDSSIDKFHPVIFIEIINNYLKKFGHSVDDVFNFFQRKGYKGFEFGKSGKLMEIFDPKDVGLGIFIHYSSVDNVKSQILHL